MTDPNAWMHQDAPPPWAAQPAPGAWVEPAPHQDPAAVGESPHPAAGQAVLPESQGGAEHDVGQQPLWEYKVISATFGGKLETELNAWGADGWEVVSIAGMGGTVTVTGNKIFVVLKRRSLANEAAASAAASYLDTLRNHYGPAVFDQLANKHGAEPMLRATRALIASGRQPNNPLGVLDWACPIMANRKHSNDSQVIEAVWFKAEGQPFPR